MCTENALQEAEPINKGKKTGPGGTLKKRSAASNFWFIWDMNRVVQRGPKLVAIPVYQKASAVMDMY